MTRTALPQERLVRLGLGPDGLPYLDLLGRGPGRGFYVVADRAILLDALGEKGVGRVFKGKARPLAPDEAMRHVEDAVRRLDERLLELIGLARRAGVLEVGMDAVVRLLKDARSSEALALIAEDASDRTRRRVEAEAERAALTCVVLAHDKVTLGARLGKDAVSVVAVRPSKLAGRLAAEVDRRTGLGGSVGPRPGEGEVN